MIIFDGQILQDYGVYIDDSGAHNKARRAYEKVSIPGRNGDLTYSDDRFENVEQKLKFLIKNQFVDRYTRLLQTLQAKEGYKRLELGTEPEFYREVMISEIGDPETGPWAHYAIFEITLDAMPQRWYKQGERKRTNPEVLINPSEFTARPLVRVYGSGTLKIGSETMIIAAHSHSYIDVDCEMQNCYCGSVNCNSLVTFASGDFPTLPAGRTGMSYTGTKFEITPRWWTI